MNAAVQLEQQEDSHFAIRFGIFVSTLLTLAVIPVMYYVAYRGRYARQVRT